ncbi:MAG: hypothetical protein ACO2OV_03535, partial [Thermoproteota archaeon]
PFLEIAYEKVELVCKKMGVPRGLWLIYYAFDFTYVQKVFSNKPWDINTEIERFVELGADRTVLKELARVLQGGKL